MFGLLKLGFKLKIALDLSFKLYKTYAMVLLGIIW